MTPPGVAPYKQLRYQQIAGKRMAYIDEGHGDAIVFQHGNPTSSYRGAMSCPIWKVWATGGV